MSCKASIKSIFLHWACSITHCLYTEASNGVSGTKFRFPLLNQAVRKYFFNEANQKPSLTFCITWRKNFLFRCTSIVLVKMSFFCSFIKGRWPEMSPALKQESKEEFVHCWRNRLLESKKVSLLILSLECSTFTIRSNTIIMTVSEFGALLRNLVVYLSKVHGVWHLKGASWR